MAVIQRQVCRTRWIPVLLSAAGCRSCALCMYVLHTAAACRKLQEAAGSCTAHRTLHTAHCTLTHCTPITPCSHTGLTNSFLLPAPLLQRSTSCTTASTQPATSCPSPETPAGQHSRQQTTTTTSGATTTTTMWIRAVLCPAVAAAGPCAGQLLAGAGARGPSRRPGGARQAGSRLHSQLRLPMCSCRRHSSAWCT